MVELQYLKQRQILPLKAKISMTNRRIREWYEHYNGKVYVAFSGGKDSTVLLHLVRKLYLDVPAVFCDTGLEYPEIREFVKTFENVITIRPKMNFKQVLEKYGYPVISKTVAATLHRLRDCNLTERYRNKLLYGDERGDAGRLPKKYRYLLHAPFKISEQCCDVMKKRPFKKYEKESGRKAFIGTMTEDSRNREIQYLREGCNNYTKELSMPLSFWLQKDIWDYIKKKKLQYCSVYNTGVSNTGCIFCMFGVQFDGDPNRFQCMAKSHPKLYDYCLNKLGLKEILEFINIEYKMGVAIPPISKDKGILATFL
jgi:3'-phosphoadenosine 5'-phosphosulfate sulfotransferase (PAPS reductase)/FAD synthetase